MSVYCIADFHLSNQVDKPMHKFGPHWVDHDKKIAANLQAVMGEDDVLLVPGDISWAINFQEAKKDLLFIDQLPGHKYLLRGNHDYWWATMQKNYRQLAEMGIKSVDFLQNNAFRIEDKDLGGLLLAGTRGWIFPSAPNWKAEHQKILDRELNRLQISLREAEKLRRDGDRLIVITHYPPVNQHLHSSDFTRLMRDSGAELCLFGHIHHKPSPYHLWGKAVDGVQLYLSACDQIDFKPLRVDDYLRDEHI